MPSRKEIARASLERCLSRVPNKVLGGGIVLARRYKDWAASASAALKKRGTSQFELDALLIQYEDFADR